MDDVFDLALSENGRGVLFTQISSIHGYGLFTSTNLPAETILCRRLGLKAPLSLRDKRAIIGIDGVDAGIAEDDIFKRINHSCFPNAILTDTGCLVNVKKITSETEITVDYAIFLEGSTWQAACLCGSVKCRGFLNSIR